LEHPQDQSCHPEISPLTVTWIPTSLPVTPVVDDPPTVDEVDEAVAEVDEAEVAEAEAEVEVAEAEVDEAEVAEAEVEVAAAAVVEADELPPLQLEETEAGVWN
jgi:hypothetical protein